MDKQTVAHQYYEMLLSTLKKQTTDRHNNLNASHMYYTK